MHSLGQGLSNLEPESGMLEMISPSVRERLVRLEHENKRLKQQSSKSTDTSGAMQQVLDDMKEREAKLEASNRRFNQRVMELEAKLEESPNNAHPPRVPGSREELELKLAEANKKYISLQETLQSRDRDMQVMEEKYKR